MSLTISKRTRTLTDEVYSEWTEWAVTTDSPPYNNTDILEYKITSDYDNNVDFDEKYYEVYGKIMAEAIKDGTPYKESIDYISSEFENFNLTDIQKADLTVKYIASITNPVTIQAMQVAMSLADKDLKAPNEIAMQEVQKDIAIATKPDKVAISEWQEKTAEENYNYAREKAIALPQSIIFNNYSKTLDYFKEAYGQHKIGGGTITQSMWTPPLEVAKALMTSNTNYDFNYTAPTTSE